MDEDWERDVRFDQSTQELIINLQDCSSESESDFDDAMQRIISLTRTLTKMSLSRCLPGITYSCTHFSTLQSKVPVPKLLTPYTTIMNQVCGFKVKGRLKRRCQSCYFVVRDERLYVICPKHPRHKAMAMKPKPHNTWILTHASQSPVRPW